MNLLLLDLELSCDKNQVFTVKFSIANNSSDSGLSPTFFGHVMRSEKPEYHVTTGMMERKCSWERRPEKLLDGLTKWLKVGLTEALKVGTERDALKVIITYAKEQDT